MPQVRVFNPTIYTPRGSFGAGGGKGGATIMAKHHRYHRKHHHQYRHNPFGLSSGVVKDAAFNAAGALGSLAISNLVPNMTGWAGVGLTAVAAIGASFVGRMVAGPKGAEEVLKGGLVATIIKGLHQAGIASQIGLGLYAPSWFGVPTASSQYLQASQANLGPYRRGQGTIFFPGPGGTMMAAAAPATPGVPTGAHPAAVAAAGVHGVGFHRFRSRYAGNY
jgi:hypothetical protein